MATRPRLIWSQFEASQVFSKKKISFFLAGRHAVVGVPRAYPSAPGPIWDPLTASHGTWPTASCPRVGWGGEQGGNGDENGDGKGEGEHGEGRWRWRAGGATHSIQARRTNTHAMLPPPRVLTCACVLARVSCTDVTSAPRRHPHHRHPLRFRRSPRYLHQRKPRGECGSRRRRG